MERINKQVDTAVVDSIIREAAICAFELEMSELSVEYEKKDENPVKRKKYIKKIDKAYAKAVSRHNASYYWFRNIAAVILCVSTLGFAALLSLPVVRAEAFDTAINFFEKYLSFDFTNDKMSNLTLGSVTLGWVPKGYVLTDSFQADALSYFTLTDEYSNEMIFSYGPSTLYTPQIDAENLAQSMILVDGISVYLFSENSNQHIIAVWNNGSMTFLLDSYLIENDIVNFIENIG